MAKKKEIKKDNTSLAVQPSAPANADLVLPSSIAGKFKAKQLTYDYLIPTEDVPVFVQVLDGEIGKEKIKGKQNKMEVIKVVNILTGEECKLALKLVLKNIFIEQGYITGEEDDQRIDNAVGECFQITAKATRDSKENSGNSYTPYSLTLLEPLD